MDVATAAVVAVVVVVAVVAVAATGVTTTMATVDAATVTSTRRTLVARDAAANNTTMIVALGTRTAPASLATASQLAVVAAIPKKKATVESVPTPRKSLLVWQRSVVTLRPAKERKRSLQSKRNPRTPASPWLSTKRRCWPRSELRLLL